MNYEDIRGCLKNIPPYVFVDKAEVEVGKAAHGIKNFALNEWFFQCHFPDDPIVPGVFQIEAITQTAALAIHPMENMGDNKIILKKFVNVDFLHGVRPGDQLFIDAIIQSFRRGIIKALGEAYIVENDEKIITCRAEFMMIVPNMTREFTPPPVQPVKRNSEER